MNQKVNTARLTRIAVYIALALILGLIEGLIPPLFVFAPGAKIGLGNIVTLTAIICLGYFDAGVILIVRCVFGAIFSGNYFGMVYSLGGGASAMLVMSLLYKFFSGKLSILSISIAGAVVHNTVQTFIASLVMSQINYMLLLPFMLIASTLAGIVVGLSVFFIIKYIPAKILLSRKKEKQKAFNVETNNKGL